MSKIDKEIEALGFEIRVLDLSCGYIVYENKQSDSEIIIEWDDEEEYCKIFFTNNFENQGLVWTNFSRTTGINYSRNSSIYY
jgi:hypothetical protein